MRREARYLHDGAHLTLKEIAGRVGRTVETVRNKLACGWTVAEVLSGAPVSQVQRDAIRRLAEGLPSLSGGEGREPPKPWPKVVGRVKRGVYMLGDREVSIHDLVALSGQQGATIRRRIRRGLTVAQAIR